MKILVCISKSPDTTSKIAFTDGNKQFDENGVQYIVNPYDEWYALVRGLELKETLGGNLTIVTVGTVADEAVIRKALDLPFVSLATKLDITGATARMEREIVGGLQIVEANLPLVVSCAKGMAEQRIPNMRGIMAARTKPLQVVPASAVEDLTTYVEYGLPAAKSAVKMIDPNNMDELVELLHNEAKVI